MTTEVDVKTVDWRPPPIKGIPGLWRRNQSTDLAAATFGNPLRRWYLTWVHRAVRMAEDDTVDVMRIDAPRSDLHQLAPSRYTTFGRQDETNEHGRRIRHR